MVKTVSIILVGLALSFSGMAQKITSFQPAKVWPDTEGKHINAHGGGILKQGKTYYWYGENRPDAGGSMNTGISVYASRDLMNWENRGIALSVSQDTLSPIQSGCIMERPKVVYNKKTKKYVMLFHLELKGQGYAAAQVGFAVADKPEGPFRFLKGLRPNAGKWPANFTQKNIEEALALDPNQYTEWWTPEWRKAVEKGLFVARDLKGGQMSRDMTVYVDDDGKAYHLFSSEENLTLHLAELTDDYLDYTGKYIRIAPGGLNEAPALFKHDGKYWLITSGCTGWAPNEARMFVADSLCGEWKQLPTPFVGENAEKTFNGQSTFVLPYKNKGFIFMGDIWKPKSLITSQYLWLPIQFKEDGTPTISYRAEWTLKDLMK